MKGGKILPCPHPCIFTAICAETVWLAEEQLGDVFARIHLEPDNVRSRKKESVCNVSRNRKAKGRGSPESSREKKGTCAMMEQQRLVYKRLDLWSVASKTSNMKVRTGGQ